MKWDFKVAGVKFHQLKECIDQVKVGDHLSMVAEPSNPYDSNAVRLEFPEDDGTYMVGYVPAKISAEVAAALTITDLKCVVTEVNPAARTWEQLHVEISEV